MKSWTERPADLVLLVVTADPLAQVHRVRAETDVPLALIITPIAEDLHYDLLEAGADRVLSRPYSGWLLIAQIRALMRRAGTVPLFSLPTLIQAGLTLDAGARTVQVADHPPARLTHLEFRLLHTLMSHRGQVLPTDVIVERVWGYTGRGDRELLRGLVSRLRAKIEPEPRSPRYIHTLPGVGYSFNPDET